MAKSSSSELDAKDGFEIAFKRFPESQMAQLYTQRKEGRFCDAVMNCSDGEFKAHRYASLVAGMPDGSIQVNL